MPQRLAMPAPQPLLIDAAGHVCVAWWHAPAPAPDARLAPALPRGWLPGGALPLAVVLASSWGEEDMSGYDGQRALAIQLAEGGLGTLRFEWPDTGDSSAATGTTSVADALAAFDAAAVQALALSGHARLAFVGLRLGALLAAHAAVARQDVDALVALLPVAGGRAFVREQDAQDIRVPTRTPPGVAPALFDAAELPVCLGGFALPVRRLEALSVLKWPAAATTSVLEALVVQPSRSPGRTVADALARMGMRVREWAHEDPACARSATGEPAGLPLAGHEVVRWLRQRAADATVTRGVRAIENFGAADPGNGPIHAALASAQLEAATTAVLALAAGDAPVWMRLRAGATGLRERVVLLQESREPALVGVLGERDTGDAAVDRPPRHAVVLLSSGPERRIGPRRAWVDWARHRAALGDVTLRLDMEGVGDSVAAAGPHDWTACDGARVVDGVNRAVAWLRRECGVRDCTLVAEGLGASHAWRAALAGVDVQRVIAVDPARLDGRPLEHRPPAVPTVAARVRRALHRCSRGMGRLFRKAQRDELAAEAARAGARGVAIHVVCAERERGLALVRRALGRGGAGLLREGRMAIAEIAMADPAFASLAGRAELCRRFDALLQAPRSTPDEAAAAPPWQAARALA